MQQRVIGSEDINLVPLAVELTGKQLNGADDPAGIWAIAIGKKTNLQLFTPQNGDKGIIFF
jgi:hypothetical protein